MVFRGAGSRICLGRWVRSCTERAAPITNRRNGRLRPNCPAANGLALKASFVFCSAENGEIFLGGGRRLKAHCGGLLAVCGSRVRIPLLVGILPIGIMQKEFFVGFLPTVINRNV